MEELFCKIFCKSTIERIDAKVKLLGVSANFSVGSFLIYRLILVVLVFILSFIFSSYGYILAPILAVLVYVLTEKIFLDMAIKKRVKKLEKEALFFFEILLLTIDSGRDIGHAIKLTSSSIDSELSLEFRKMLQEVELGKSLAEALESLKLRIPSDAINNAILNLIQSNRYGGSVLEGVSNQLDYLRDKQILNVKAEIAKLPTKISVLSVLFFIPIMFLIILAPVLINYIIK